jgi:serralysin
MSAYVLTNLAGQGFSITASGELSLSFLNEQGLTYVYDPSLSNSNPFGGLNHTLSVWNVSGSVLGRITIDAYAMEGGNGQTISFLSTNGEILFSVSKFDQTPIDQPDRLLKNALSFDTTGKDHYEGNDYTDVIYAGSGDDDLFGGAGNDVLYGEDGNDLIDGGTGADIMVGGNGDDDYEVDNPNDTIIEGATGGIDKVVASLAHYELASGVENLTFFTDLNVVGVGNNLSNYIRGSNGNDAVYGGAGNDTLNGSFGNDTLDGGADYDVADYFGGRGDFIILKNADGSISVKDTWLDDGDEGVDTLLGIEALHFRDGLVTIDSLFSVTPVTQPPTLQPPTPQPPVIAPTTSNSDMIVGSNADEKLYGGGGNDQVSGGAGNDWVYGGSGNDQLVGGIGNDRLYGEAGKDQLTGGSGKDWFVFNSKPSRTTNIDKIVDFNVRDDSIYLENAIFKALGKAGSSTKPALLKSSFFYSGSKAHDKDDHIIYNKSSGAIYYDADGTGSSQQVQIATVKKGLVLTYKDFFVI